MNWCALLCYALILIIKTLYSPCAVAPQLLSGLWFFLLGSFSRLFSLSSTLLSLCFISDFAGLDTFSFRAKPHPTAISIFELDQPLLVSRTFSKRELRLNSTFSKQIWTFSKHKRTFSKHAFLFLQGEHSPNKAYFLQTNANFLQT